MATTPTPCEQAVLDLAAFRKALADLLTGKRVITMREADKEIQYYAAGNIGDLQQLIRQTQATVNRCNGCTRPWPVMAPSDL